MSAPNWIYFDFELYVKEVGVFTGESAAVKLLYHHCCWLFVLQTNPENISNT